MVARELLVVGFGVVMGTLRDVEVVEMTVGLGGTGSIFSVTKIGFLLSSFFTSSPEFELVKDVLLLLLLFCGGGVVDLDPPFTEDLFPATTSLWWSLLAHGRL